MEVGNTTSDNLCNNDLSFVLNPIIQAEKKEFYVYLIQNKTDGTIYLGETGNPIQRWRNHLDAAFGDDPRKQYYLHKAIKKHGKENFTFDVIETHPTEAEALEAEVFLIAYFKGLGAKLYNLTVGGEGCSGRVVSAETRKKISIAHTGKKLTDAQKEHLRIINTGKKVAPEVGQKVSAALKGKKFSEEKKQKYRKPKSEEAKKNMSLAQKKFYAELPPEEKERRKKELYNNTHTEEILEKNRGENKCNAKLKDKDIIDIREKYATGKYTHKQLAKEYNIDRGTVTDIIRHKTWKHLEDNTDKSFINSKRGNNKLVEKQVLEIRERYTSDPKKYSCKNLAEEYKVSSDLIYRIIRGELWKHLLGEK